MHGTEEVWDEELAERLHMNAEALALLAEKGVQPGQKTRLDYTFVTESRTNAQKLAAFIEQETDYTAKVVNNDGEFEISGQTSEIELSLETVNAWVTWLVKEGRRFDCTFDGWFAPMLIQKKSNSAAQKPE